MNPGAVPLPGTWGAGPHELPAFTELAEKYGLVYGSPDWLADVVARYGLRRPTH